MFYLAIGPISSISSPIWLWETALAFQVCGHHVTTSFERPQTACIRTSILVNRHSHCIAYCLENSTVHIISAGSKIYLRYLVN